MHSPPRHWVAQLPLIPYALIACCFLVATAFTFLQTDDYCTFGRVIHRHGGNPLADVYLLYMEWTGRYSASIVVALVAAASALVNPAWVYPLALMVFIALFAWACMLLSRLSTRHLTTHLPLAAVMLASTLLITPSKLEQFFWLTGAAVYFVGASLALVLVYRLRAGETRAAGHKPLREISTHLIIVATVGFNEFLALVVGACLSWSIVQDFRNRAEDRQWRTHIIRMSVFLAALALTILAPGNFSRDAASTTLRHDVMGSLAMMVESMGFLARSLFAESGLPLVASLAAAFASGWLVPSSDKQHVRQGLPYMVILILALPMHLWVYSFLTGESTPGRVMNQAVLLAHLALCVCLAWGGSVMANRRSAERRSTLPANIALSLAGVMLLLSPSTVEFAKAVLNFAPTWRAEQLQRHSGLSNVQEHKPVYVRPFSSGDSDPRTFSGTDVTADPSNWINKCVADYYEVNSVIQMRPTN